MKRIYKYGILFLAAAAILSSCVKDKFDSGAEGWVSLSGISVDTKENIVTKSDPREPDADMVISVDIIDAGDNVVMSFNDFREIPEKISLKTGDYTLVAKYGNFTTEASFDNPTLKGVKPFTVAPGTLSAVEVVCRPAYVKVAIAYSDEFKDNFTNYSTIISNGQGSIVFDGDEARDAYIIARETLSCSVTVTNLQDKVYTSEPIVYDDLTGGDYLKLHIDIAEKPGNDDNQAIKLSINENINDVETEITVDLIKGVPPYFEGDGFNESEKIQIAQGATKTVKINIGSEQGLKNVYMRQNSQYLIDIAIPTLTDFMNVTPQQAAALAVAGISYYVENEGKSLIVDLTGITEKLPKAEDGALEHSLEFIVTDNERQFIRRDITFYVMGTPLLASHADASGEYVWSADNGLGSTAATLYGSWVSLDKPEALTFMYKTDNDPGWTAVPASELSFDDNEKQVWVTVTGLKLNRTYIFKLSSEGDESGEIRFTTGYPEIANMNFDNWYLDGSTYYPNEKGAPTIWSTGNPGLTFWMVNKPSNTVPEESFVIKGKAVKMTSVQVPVVGFAAGNLFTGEFNLNIGSPAESVKFGKPYTGRPARLAGYYCYQSRTIDTGKSHIGETDQCHIYISLEDWDGASERPASPTVIGYGELKDDRVMSGYERFSIAVEYYSTAQPTHIVMVATSSIYGEEYVGGTGSTLYFDEFEFEFD